MTGFHTALLPIGPGAPQLDLKGSGCYAVLLYQNIMLHSRASSFLMGMQLSGQHQCSTAKTRGFHTQLDEGPETP